MSHSRWGALALAAALGACATPRVVAPLRYRDAPPPAPDAPFRAIAPPVLPVVEPPAPPLQEFALANGLRVILLERHDVPFVSLRLVARRSALDIGDPGALRVGQMSFLYSRGGGDLAEQHFTAEAATLGVGANEGASADCLTWSARGPAEAFGTAIELLARRSFGARLTTAEFNHRRSELLQHAHSGRRSASFAERYVLFGDKHPYGYAGQGEEPISQAEAEALRASLLQPNRATLLVVGDTTLVQVRHEVAKGFAAVSSSAATAESDALVSAPDFLRSPWAFVENNTVQQYASITAQGPPATPDDAATLAVVKQLLSGMGSVVETEVREEMGASYGSTMAMTLGRARTWFVIAGNYDRDKVTDAIDAELAVLERLRRGEVSDAELAGAREAARGDLRETLATVDGMASAYAEAIGVGDDLAAFGQTAERLGKVGRDDIRRTASRYFDPARLHVVIIGEPTGTQGIRIAAGLIEEITLPK